MSLQSSGLEKVWDSDYMRSVRRNMLAGKPVADCTGCYDAEKNVGASRRTQSNVLWAAELGPDFDSRVEESARLGNFAARRPIYYQLIPGNLCNLKCRMCFPIFSSKIEQDEVHSHWSAPLFGEPSESALPSMIGRDKGLSRLPNGPWYRDDAWVREVLLENAERIRGLYFTGGEPMIEKQVEKILDHLIDRGVERNITLEFNTNCTVLRDSMLEKLQRFKKVILSLSLDAYGAYHEYIRYPSDWRVIGRNVERLTALAGNQLHLSAGPVLQVYNALNLSEVLRFLDKMNIHYRITIASMPWFLAVDILPARIRQLAAERLTAYAAERQADETQAHVLSVASYLKSLKDRCTMDSLQTLMLFTNDLDASRGQNVKVVHSELVTLLKEEGFVWTDERSPASLLAGKGDH
jgi:organic radical activating enzyme